MEKLELSHKMAVASLVAEKMFNFSELIEKNFFKSLVGSQYEWIYHLSLSFNSSKVDQFLAMLNEYENHIKNDVNIVINNKR